MIRASYLARLPDGLPLIAAMGNDQELYASFPDYKAHFKNITRSVCDGTLKDPQCTLTANAYTFHFQIDLNVIYICLTDRSFPKKDAFAFLDTLRSKLYLTYSPEQIQSAHRPFSLLRFETELEELQRTPNAHGQQYTAALQTELAGVARVMSRNIEDLVMRGEKINTLADLTSHLSAESKKYATDARMLNLRAMYRKYAPLVVTLIVVFLIWCMWRSFS